MHSTHPGWGVLALAGFALTAAPAMAQHEEHGHDEHGRAEVRHEAPVYHGDISRFHEHDWAVWHEGRWYHGDHSGRLGWWWVAGGLWYFYPYPVYPYPDPYLPPDLPVPAVPLPPTPTAWYYCNSARSYYPYVTACPEGWQAVAPSLAAPPPAPPR